jgi:hypothetical protein
VFGKRKTPVASAATTRSEPPMGVGTFSTVIVPRSAFEAARDPQQAHRLVKALVDFVNAMTGQGLYTRDELLPKAAQAFHADYYLAQVHNGGHGQFIHNSMGNVDFALADVHAALTAIQTEPYTSIGARLIADCAARRDPVTRKIDLSQREPDVLSELDHEFYKADRESPFRNVLGRWIATWPELRPVEDADYPEAMRLSASMNPLRELRLKWRSVNRLRAQTTDRFQVAVGMALVKIERSELRAEVGAGIGVEIDGAKEIAFTVRTYGNLIFLCVVKPEYSAAYQYFPANFPNIPNLHTDPEVFLKAIKEDRLKDVTGPRAGAQLSRVSGLMIDDVITLSKEYRAGLAIDLLLRRAGVEPGTAMVVAHAIVPRAEGDPLRWMMMAGKQAFAVLTTPDGAALLPGESAQPLATVGKRDLDDYDNHIAAGSMEAKPL